MLFTGLLYFRDIFSKEEKAARWKVPIRSFHMTDDSSGGDRDSCAMRQAQPVHCLRSRYVRRQFGVASRNPLIE